MIMNMLSLLMLTLAFTGVYFLLFPKVKKTDDAEPDDEMSDESEEESKTSEDKESNEKK